jgi:hypothetical protein
MTKLQDVATINEFMMLVFGVNKNQNSSVYFSSHCSYYPPCCFISMHGTRARHSRYETGSHRKMHPVSNSISSLQQATSTVFTKTIQKKATVCTFDHYSISTLTNQPINQSINQPIIQSCPTTAIRNNLKKNSHHTLYQSITMSIPIRCASWSLQTITWAIWKEILSEAMIPLPHLKKSCCFPRDTRYEVLIIINDVA